MTRINQPVEAGRGLTHLVRPYLGFQTMTALILMLTPRIKAILKGTFEEGTLVETFWLSQSLARTCL